MDIKLSQLLANPACKFLADHVLGETNAAWYLMATASTESDFRINAVSSSKATSPWQFIPRTIKLFFKKYNGGKTPFSLPPWSTDPSVSIQYAAAHAVEDAMWARSTLSDIKKGISIPSLPDNVRSIISRYPDPAALVILMRYHYHTGGSVKNAKRVSDPSDPLSSEVINSLNKRWLPRLNASISKANASFSLDTVYTFKV